MLIAYNIVDGEGRHIYKEGQRTFTKGKYQSGNSLTVFSWGYYVLYIHQKINMSYS